MHLYARYTLYVQYLYIQCIILVHTVYIILIHTVYIILVHTVYNYNNYAYSVYNNKYSWTLRHSISAIDHASFDGAV